MPSLPSAVDEAKVDVLYASGPLMAHLWDKTPASRRGAYADNVGRILRPRCSAG